MVASTMLHDKHSAFTFLVSIMLCWSAPRSAAWSFENLAAMSQSVGRRSALASVVSGATILSNPVPSLAQEVEVAASGDTRKLFNDGRAMESQGNMAAAQRLYSKVTKISPQFIYGWSNLGNTQVALGDLKSADENYSKAIALCQESLDATEASFGVKRCTDLYILLLNRGTVRLNSGNLKEALADLEKASILREKPDATVLQNLARAREMNGFYSQADRDYAVAISMTANEVNPFWLRAAIVKLQLGDIDDGFNLFKRVENRFPEAPEVKAAYAVFLKAKGEDIPARRKFLEIPDRQRLKYSDKQYLQGVINWPPAAVDAITNLASLVGDLKLV